MANNFIQHGRRACELCHFLDLTNAVKNFAKRTMEISLTFSKIVLLLLERQYVRMSPNPVLKKYAWICFWTVYFPNTQQVATSQRRWNFVLFRHPPYIFSKIIHGCAAEQEKNKSQIARTRPTSSHLDLALGQFLYLAATPSRKHRTMGNWVKAGNWNIQNKENVGRTRDLHAGIRW